MPKSRNQSRQTSPTRTSSGQETLRTQVEGHGENHATTGTIKTNLVQQLMTFPDTFTPHAHVATTETHRNMSACIDHSAYAPAPSEYTQNFVTPGGNSGRGSVDDSAGHLGAHNHPAALDTFQTQMMHNMSHGPGPHSKHSSTDWDNGAQAWTPNFQSLDNSTTTDYFHTPEPHAQHSATDWNHGPQAWTSSFHSLDNSIDSYISHGSEPYTQHDWNHEPQTWSSIATGFNAQGHFSDAGDILAPPRNNSVVYNATYFMNQGASNFTIHQANFNANSGPSFLEILKLKFPHSNEAFFDTDISGLTRRYCTPDTRVQILEDIETWVMDPSRGSGYWISGMAGTGKSTIAMSICRALKNKRLLAGSFFCNRQIAKCRDYRLIIPTLAYQLAKFSEPFARGLKAVLDQDFDLASKAPFEQMKSLLIEPWKLAVVAFQQFNGQPDVPVVVIDALDECNDVSIALQELVVAIQARKLQGLKFIFTSRPEQTIMRKMKGISSLQPVLQVEQFVLHNVEEASVQKDIIHYLEQELRDINPSEKEIGCLAKLSGNLFIYAATAAKYILSGGAPSWIEKRLQDSVKPGQQMGNLNILYTNILDEAIYGGQRRKTEEQEIRESWKIIHAIMALEAPLQCSAIAELLQLREDTMWNFQNMKV
ncbi:hypothetical protein D9757_009161 [Collybiopsis confluens]|uniref:Nephrocystin 3-like N-terminal domain-containing protein n=1 Tax=Collybiopsis confluens TaxID=2823264 RepID=A0A8H5M285_9AGAR|nr:hypothetical protein D9757_009161 [Collybiopsis confluens]